MSRVEADARHLPEALTSVKAAKGWDVVSTSDLWVQLWLAASAAPAAAAGLRAARRGAGDPDPDQASTAPHSAPTRRRPGGVILDKVFFTDAARLWILPEPKPKPCEFAPPAWSGPYWDAAVLDEVWLAHGQRLTAEGLAITDPIHRAYQEAPAE